MPDGKNQAHDLVLKYFRHDWCPIPVPPRSKNPNRPGWQNERLSINDIPTRFPEDSNVGLLLGAPSQNLVDVDLDTPEAREAADHFLPATDLIHGRPGAPRSHFFYQTMGAIETVRFPDTAGAGAKSHGSTMLCELRSTGAQTIVEPSIHPSGETIRWDRFGTPGEIEAGVLRTAVGLVAACALLARHWPADGVRHQFALAVAGFLLRGELDDDTAVELVARSAEIAGDEEAVDRRRAAEDTAHQVAQNGKTTGLPTLARIVGGAEAQAITERLRSFLELEPTAALIPSAEVGSIKPEERWPDALAQEALCGLAGRVVATIDPNTEADQAAVLFQFLTALGNVVGRSANYQVEADSHYTNLYCVLVGQSSKARKGTSFGHVVRLFRPVDESWSTDRLVFGGLSSGEGLIWNVRDAIYRWERDRKSGDSEEVLVDPGVTDKRLLVVESEFASTLRVMGREGNTLSPVIRNAWDRSDLQTMTKNSPAKATGAHISIVGHVTDDELRRYLTVTEAGNGFANRFLWVCVRRSKCLPEGGCLSEQNLEPLVRSLREAVEFARGTARIERDAEARELWAQVYPGLSDGRPGLSGSVTSRAEAQTMRLALLYALLDQSTHIRTGHLLAALALWEYAEESAQCIFGDALGDPLADEILALLRRNPDGLARTEVHHHFSRNRRSSDLQRAFESLVERKLASLTKRATRGRHAEVWAAIGRNDAGLDAREFV